MVFFGLSRQLPCEHGLDWGRSALELADARGVSPAPFLACARSPAPEPRPPTPPAMPPRPHMHSFWPQVPAGSTVETGELEPYP